MYQFSENISSIDDHEVKDFAFRIFQVFKKRQVHLFEDYSASDWFWKSVSLSSKSVSVSVSYEVLIAEILSDTFTASSTIYTRVHWQGERTWRERVLTQFWIGPCDLRTMECIEVLLFYCYIFFSLTSYKGMLLMTVSWVRNTGSSIGDCLVLVTFLMTEDPSWARGFLR